MLTRACMLFIVKNTFVNVYKFVHCAFRFHLFVYKAVGAIYRATLKNLGVLTEGGIKGVFLNKIPEETKFDVNIQNPDCN